VSPITRPGNNDTCVIRQSRIAAEFYQRQNSIYTIKDEGEYYERERERERESNNRAKFGSLAGKFALFNGIFFKKREFTERSSAKTAVFFTMTAL
jgi:hypothetical protein